MMWEYLVKIIRPSREFSGITTKLKHMEDDLNLLGQQGWELVQMSPEGVAVFKRFVYKKKITLEHGKFTSI